MKVCFVTLGCDKNISDSECAMGLLSERGYEIVDFPEEADFMVVNTCGFIKDAKEESIDVILECGELKTPRQKLIVTGCLSQRYGSELEKELPEVDVFLGVDDYDRLPQVLEDLNRSQGGDHAFPGRQAPPGGGPGLAEEFSGLSKLQVGKPSKTYKEFGRRLTPRNSFSSPLKIAEGCNNVCSYCSIPYIRGMYRSRDFDAVIGEAESLAQNGCRELILVAQDVTSYGLDTAGEYMLPSLLGRLCLIDGIRWIRLMYCYEEHITPALIKTVKEQEKICKYMDIPVQHGSDSVLKAMNRRSREASIRSTIKTLRKEIPEIAVRTTVMTGFPGETEEDFERTLNMVEDLKFERLGVFTYSREEGTAAAKMENQVPERVKKERRDRIMELQMKISLEKNEHLIGTTMEVLVEEEAGDGNYFGRTYMDAPEIDNSVYFSSQKPLKPGDFAPVHIYKAAEYDLEGFAASRNGIDSSIRTAPAPDIREDEE